MNPGAAVVVERELLRTSRRWQTVAARVAFAAILLLFVAAFWRNEVQRSSWDPTQFARSGRNLFEMYSAVLFGGICLLTPPLVAQGIVEERNSGTLHLLSITRIPPRRLLLGKLLSRIVVLWALVLGTLPVLALCLSLGGVEPVRLVNIATQCSAALLGLSAVSVAFSLHATSPLVPTLAAWAWGLVAWFFIPLGPRMLAELLAWLFGGYRGSYALWDLEPLLLSAPGALMEYEGWGTVVGPLLFVLPASFALLGHAAQRFELEATEEGAAHLSPRFWDLERRRKRSVLAALGLAVTALPVLVWLEATDADGWVSQGPPLLWATATLAVGSVMAVRGFVWGKGFAGRFGQQGWQRWQRKRARAEAEGRPISAVARPVWGNPVAWREVRTDAHGPVGRWLLRAYVVYLLLLGGNIGLGWLRPQAALVWAVLNLGVAYLMVVLAACSSMAGELRAGSWPLLLASRMPARRIWAGKVAGLMSLALPPLATVLLLIPAGALTIGRRYGWESGAGGDVYGLWVLALSGCSAASVGYLGSSTLAFGLFVRKPATLWVLGFAQPIALVVAPLMGSLVLFGKDMPDAVALWLPFVHDGFMHRSYVPWEVWGSIAIWSALSLGWFALGVARLRRLSAR